MPSNARPRRSSSHARRRSADWRRRADAGTAAIPERHSRRGGAATGTSVAPSNSVTPPTRMCPRSGLSSPATMLSTLVLPTPDGPNSTVMPSPALQCAARRRCRRAASRRRGQSAMDSPRRAPPREQLGRDQRRQRRAAPTSPPAAAPSRRRRAAGARRRSPAAASRVSPGHVRDEGDRRAELAERAREAEHRAGEHAGQAERQA